MNILVIGSGGIIGRAVLRALAERGHQAFGAARHPPPQPVQGTQSLVFDRADVAAVASAVAKHRIDVVIDMIAYAEKDTSALLNALDGAIGRYVLISSADVYRNYGLLHRREHGAADLGDMSEDAALRTSRYPYRGAVARAADDPAKWMDDYDKIPVEAATRTLSNDWTILRLPMVFGPGDRQQRFRWALYPLLAGAPDLELPRAWLDWTTTYSFVDNLADAIAHATTAAGARRQVFNIVDTPAVSHMTWLGRFADAAQWKGSVGVSTDPSHRLALATSGLDLGVPLKVSGEAFEKACGWSAPVALNVVVATMLQHAERRPPNAT